MKDLMCLVKNVDLDFFFFFPFSWCPTNSLTVWAAVIKYHRNFSQFGVWKPEIRLRSGGRAALPGCRLPTPHPVLT